MAIGQRNGVDGTTKALTIKLWQMPPSLPLPPSLLSGLLIEVPFGCGLCSHHFTDCHSAGALVLLPTIKHCADGKDVPKPAKKATPKTTLEPVATLKPQGSTTKRTPTSAFDGAAGKDIGQAKYFAAPASCGGVECSQLLARCTTTVKTSAKDTTLEHSLFAAFNTD